MKLRDRDKAFISAATVALALLLLPWRLLVALAIIAAGACLYGKPAWEWFKANWKNESGLAEVTVVVGILLIAFVLIGMAVNASAVRPGDILTLRSADGQPVEAVIQKVYNHGRHYLIDGPDGSVVIDHRSEEIVDRRRPR